MPGDAALANGQDGHLGGAGGEGKANKARLMAYDGLQGKPGYTGGGSGEPEGGAGANKDGHLVTGAGNDLGEDDESISLANSDGAKADNGPAGYCEICWDAVPAG